MSGAILTLNELVFTLGVLTSVPVSVKIDQEIKNREIARRLTHRQTQTGFIICSMLYAIYIPYVYTGLITRTLRPCSTAVRVSVLD